MVSMAWTTIPKTKRLVPAPMVLYHTAITLSLAFAETSVPKERHRQYLEGGIAKTH